MRGGGEQLGITYRNDYKAGPLHISEENWRVELDPSGGDACYVGFNPEHEGAKLQKVIGEIDGADIVVFTTSKKLHDQAVKIRFKGEGGKAQGMKKLREGLSAQKLKEEPTLA